MERVYTVPLSKVKSVPRQKRAPRAIRYIKEFLAQHMKADEENIKLDPSISEKVWERSIKKIPSKIKLKVTKQDDGSVIAVLAGE
ncbi:MAG: 50S ribosomal protein L31e [Euryarchaeota archaeon]|nr:50S ribosomal protein L31e [Euryarchaeota archaeon]